MNIYMYRDLAETLAAQSKTNRPTSAEWPDELKGALKEKHRPRDTHPETAFLYAQLSIVSAKPLELLPSITIVSVGQDRSVRAWQSLDLSEPAYVIDRRVLTKRTLWIRACRWSACLM